MHVLVVEDDPTQADTIRKVLEREDWTVRLTETVEEADDALAEGDYDVAVVDYALPDGTGIEVLEACQRDAPDMPALFLTGTGDEDVALQALSQGAARYLTKGDSIATDLPDAVREVSEAYEGVSPVEIVEEEDGAAEVSRSWSGGEGEGTTTATEGPTPESLDALVDDIVEEPILGLGVFNDRGDVLSAKLPEDIKADAAGVLSAAVAHQFEGLSSVLDLDLEGQVLLGRGKNGVVGLTVVPGPMLVVLLTERSVSRERATRKLFQIAAQVWETTD